MAGMADNEKVGSSEQAAEHFADGAGGEFGAHESDVTAREYAAKTVEQHEPGEAEMRSGGAGVRDEGVGGNAGGRGSSSGGDAQAGDDSLIGLGDPNKSVGPDDNPPEHADRRQTVHGSTVRPPSDVNSDGNTGAANVNNLDREDNAFAGEITPGEASGQG